MAQTLYPEVLANACYLCGRLEEAIEAAHRTLQLAPDSLDARVVLAASLVETGRLEAAKQVVHQLLAIDSGFTVPRFASSQPYRDAAAFARLTDSLRRAGIVEGDPALASDIGLAAPNAPSRRRVAPRPRT